MLETEATLRSATFSANSRRRRPGALGWIRHELAVPVPRRGGTRPLCVLSGHV